MTQDPLMIYKLIILYMLNKVTFPLTTAQIGDFLLGREYTGFLNLQQAISELADAHLVSAKPGVERRIRQEKGGKDYLYFYTEKRITEDGKRWVTERPISEKDYIAYLMECDVNLHSVRKTKYRFSYQSRRFEIDMYPFSREKAVSSW